MKGSKKLAELRAKSVQVNKAYGEDVVRTSVVTNLPRIPTGSVMADYVTGLNAEGMGGWAVGHGNCLVGWQSSGKTTSALKACGNLQRMCVRCYRPAAKVQLERLVDENGDLVMVTIGHGASQREVPYYTITGRCSCYAEGLWAPTTPAFKGSVKEKKEAEAEWDAYLADLKDNSFEAATIVYADAENTLDLKWAARNGLFVHQWDEEYGAQCPVANFIWMVPNYAEQAIDIVDEYILSGAVDMIVVDSIPALVPKAEREESSEDWQRGLQARLVNKAFRRWVGSQSTVRSREDGRLVTMMYIQQWRAGMGAFAANVMPGGNGQKFAYSVINEVFTSDKEERADAWANLGGSGDKGKASGKDAANSTYAVRINIKNRKNKTWPPHKTASFRLALMDDGDVRGGEILENEQLLKLGLQMGVIDKSGAKYKFRGKEYTAQSHVLAEIASSAYAKDWLSREVRKALYASAMAGE